MLEHEIEALGDVTPLACHEELNCKDCNGLPLGHQGHVPLLWLQVEQLNDHASSHNVLFSIAYVAGGQQSAPCCHHHGHHHLNGDSCCMGLAIGTRRVCYTLPQAHM